MRWLAHMLSLACLSVLATAALELVRRSLAMFKAQRPAMTVLGREGTVEFLLPERWQGHR